MSSPGQIHMPAAPYSFHAPQPPSIKINIFEKTMEQEIRGCIEMKPPRGRANRSGLTDEEMAIITRNKPQVARDNDTSWCWERRREASPVLDYIWLGPTSTIRDLDFLKTEGFTLMIVIRDARLANQGLASVDKASALLGIETTYLDIMNTHQLVGSFSRIVPLINRHMLDVHRRQITSEYATTIGHAATETSGFQRGKVLVTCETGNHRSAAVVAAYIMSVFGKNVITAVHFLSLRRLCCSFDEELKHALLSWSDIIIARSAVAVDSQNYGQPPLSVTRTEAKRRLDDMERDDTGEEANEDESVMDHERFAGRDTFIPFMDVV